MKSVILFIIVLLLVSCGSHQRPEEKDRSEKIVISAVNYPLYDFARRIGGDLIRTEFPVPADVDPAYWIPDDTSLHVFQSADIILANGADYAKWMKNVSLHASRIVNSTSSVEYRYIPLKGVSTHSHGPEGEHEHTGLAFTTWLDFQMAAAQAEAVYNAIAGKLPENKTFLEENYNSLKNELMFLDTSMKEVSGEIGEQHIIGSHPVYQYLAQAYGLNIHSVHFEPGEMPSDDQWKELDHLLEHFQAEIMLWEDKPMPEIEKILDKKGIRVCVFNPCGNLPAKGYFIENMKTNIKALQDYCSKPEP